jgi:hypothetical protein
VKYNDEELLSLLAEERRRSIGFGQGDGGELQEARIKALEYRKGVMTDVPSLKGRSGAVDMTIADAVETALPDLVEIFVAGDDVATFNPVGEGDEEAAREETEFVNHVVFEQNPGTVLIYSSIKDALLERLGILHWWYEDDEKETTREGLDEVQAGILQTENAQSKPWAKTEIEPQDDQTFSLKMTELHGKVMIRAVPPDDFSVASDTVILADTTYCVMRARPRVQDLIARGIKAKDARGLSQYSGTNDAVNLARDESGESRYASSDSDSDLRVVEVRSHYIRLDSEGKGKLSIWNVVTDDQEKIILHKEQVSHIPFGPLTPYLIPHRLIGESVADKLFEIQRIKTALLRMWLDSGYFALNQRMEVDMSAANEFTISDLLRNEVGVPVRAARAGAVTPISAGALGFDPPMALEYASTMAEGRTGIVRNAQGLNPDTLHDTARGAAALMTMAQKRLRLIARLFAEMGIKDMFLGVHQLLRECYGSGHAPPMAKLGSGWKPIKPNEWPERNAMTVHVGVGSAGKEHELVIATQRLEMMQTMVTEQGGTQGPLVDAQNIHAALKDWERAAGSKKGDAYWSDPATAPPQPPKPDPEMAKVQGQLQVEQAKVQAQTQGDAQRAQASLALDQQKHQAQMAADAEQGQQKLQLQREQMQMEGQLKQEQAAAELQMRREIAAQELELKREVALLQAHQTHEHNMAKVTASVQKPEVGGEPG